MEHSTAASMQASEGVTARLWALVEAGIAVTSDLQLDAVLRRIVETACSLVDARYGAIAVLDEDGRTRTNLVVHGVDGIDHALLGPLDAGGSQGMVEPPERGGVPDPGAGGVGRSLLAFPIASKGRVLGQLYLAQKRTGGTFTLCDERFAQALAAQAAVAVDNARLYERSLRSEAAARRRLRELELIGELGGAILAELEADRVLHLLALHARELADSDGAAIFLAEGQNLVARVCVGVDAEVLQSEVFPRSETLWGHVIETLEPVVIVDVRTDRRVRLRHPVTFRSAVIVPIVDRRGGIGTLLVSSVKVGAFGTDDIFVIKRFADLASLALHNARSVAFLRERAQMEAELERSRVRDEARAQTLRAVIRAQEEERRRIARELHDSFGQTLASILVGLSVAAEESTLEGVRRHLGRLREAAAEVAGEVRRIAFELRPAALDDFGLAASLERLGASLSSGSQITIDTTLVGCQSRYEPEIETVIYRVAQEAITNAVKHARPSHISVGLCDSGDCLRLAVVDDGCGFDPVAEGKGLGLIGMRERATLVGGDLVVTSSPEGGTTVELTVPKGGL